MGEINKTDQFGESIINTTKKFQLHNILEIGSWDGTGSTQCFIEGLQLFNTKKLTCLEVNSERFEQLKKNVQHLDWVECINTSSISLKSLQYTTFDELWESPYNYIQSPKNVVEQWYNSDILSISTTSGFLETDTTFYDGVLIDGSEFTGYSEFLLVKDRCNVLFLDDYYNAFKTRQVVVELSKNPEWECIANNKYTRGGFAVFKRIKFIK